MPLPPQEKGPEECRDRIGWIQTALLLALVTGLVYAPMLGGYFRHDDFGWLQVARQWEREGGWAIRHGAAGCTPFYNLLLALLYRLAGRTPWPYYAALILTHALASVLVFRLALTLTGRRLAAAIAGLWFGLHYVHHEAVTWVSSLYRPIALDLLLASLLLFIRYRRRGGSAPLILAAVLFGLAALTKEDALPLVLLLPLVERWLLEKEGREEGVGSRKHEGWRRGKEGGSEPPGIALRAFAPFAPLRSYLPFGFALLLYGFIRPWAWAVGGALTTGPGIYWLGPHVLTNWIRCVPQMLVPDLDFETYRQLLQRFLSPAGLEAVVGASRLLGVLGTVGAGVLFWRGPRPIRFWILWSYIMFLPFTPFAYEYARAPRYLYLPSVGLAMLVGLGMQAWDDRARGRLRRGLGAAFLLVLLANVALLGLVQKHRLRDSAVRREVLATVQAAVPNPEPGAIVYLVGVPFHLRDVGLGVALLYEVPVEGKCLQAGESIPHGTTRKQYVVHFRGGP